MLRAPESALEPSRGTGNRNAGSRWSSAAAKGRQADSQPAGDLMRVTRLDHLVLTVADVDSAAQWYEQVPGLARETLAPREGAAPRTALRIGGQLIRLRPAAAKQADWRTGRRPVAGSADLCFLVDVPAEEAVRRSAPCVYRWRPVRCPSRARRAPLCPCTAATPTAISSRSHRRFPRRPESCRLRSLICEPPAPRTRSEPKAQDRGRRHPVTACPGIPEAC